MKFIIFAIVFGAVLFGALAVEARNKASTQKEPTSYCIDPWASTDMGTRTYTPCSLVPHRYRA